ncbi:Fic family protein [Bradyrhizobium sp. SSUT77]|nr:Fic family protein [Bradyrhizobium sp. SSUT77]MDH2341410.1 Fic family protein [Bradyrhizobium sp. SSUT77]
MYPWAGQDRTTTAPNIAVSRGDVLFAHPKYIQNAIEHALKLGNDPKTMREKPGEVMGYLAHGHPFLDGNGRTIMVIHSILAQRAGFSLDWTSTDKTAYLQALTKELDDPGKGILDKYLEPCIHAAVSNLKEHIAAAKGLDGGPGEADTIRGSNDDPAVQADYKQQQLKREANGAKG